MKSLIVTNTHKNRGEVVELDLTKKKYYHADDRGRLYTENDFVDVKTVDHEQAKADLLSDYWAVVSQTIQEFKGKYGGTEVLTAVRLLWEKEGMR